MTVQEILTKTTDFFRKKNFPTPRLDAEYLLQKGLGLTRMELYLKFDQPLKEEEIDFCRSLVQRRSRNEPLAYILNSKDFFGYSFFVDSRVLIPRPETELLVESILGELKQRNLINAPLRVLDLGTGSGCVGLSLLKELPFSTGILVDISEEALEISKKNFLNLFSDHNLANDPHSEQENTSVLPHPTQEKCLFIKGNVETLTEELEFHNFFDVIVANPPYISENDPSVEESVRQFEPSLALFAQKEGTEKIEKWSLKAWSWLKEGNQMTKGGIMGFEIGKGQDLWAKDHFQKIINSQLENSTENKIETKNQFFFVKDYQGINRHCICYKR